MAKNTYYVINESDRSKVDFDEIVQSPEKVRQNLAGTQFIIKNKLVEGTPIFIENGTVVPVHTLTHLECLDLISGEEWVEEIDN